ncbi:hypothetical protein BFP97_07525 [Roseivirga sp. 4D4]|uniref:tetratricopeptide repeat protein n=1 Tax=Roseivirga sp. 4D4 TaxID=1889784 RepID=UPI000853A84B|nr:tetratricopeptide repeat protein [Roseivirga sp. 4D4]OEK01375.1 hypothetical protein BFP97_07525 [Roseivirga sp. 4D4]
MRQTTLLTFLLFIAIQTFGQDLRQTALDQYNKQDFKAAAKTYQQYLKENEGDSLDWYNLAVSSARISDHVEALDYFKEAKKHNFPPAFISFGMAKSYAALKEETKMIEVLNEGAGNGLNAIALLKNDPAFEAYQSSTGFMEVLKKVEQNAYPCLGSANYRHFDFWIGEWDVLVNGRKVGDNSITMAKGGCAIHENYTTAGNYAGQSINFFDPIDKKWHQHWVGSGGDVYNYLETKRESGLLQFQSKFMGPTGNISLSRLTFTLNDDGTVRQLFEGSTDEGKTWTPSFDGLYRKKK